MFVGIISFFTPLCQWGLVPSKFIPGLSPTEATPRILSIHFFVDCSPSMQVSPEDESAQNFMFQHPAHNHLYLLIVQVFGLKHYFNVISFVHADKISYFVFKKCFEVKLDFIQHLWHFGLADGIQ